MNSNRDIPIKKQELYSPGGINGALLKWIAIISMAIDHFGGGFLNYYPQGGLEPTFLSVNYVYTISRLIGRLAFPIFAFLMIQGYQHTSDKKKYFSKLFLFAIISEIPFDLAFYGQMFAWYHQNIFFTLAIGLFSFSLYEKFEQNNQRMLQFLSLIIPAVISQFLFVDYGAYGIIFIFGLGIFRHAKSVQTIFGVMMGSAQMTAVLAFIPIWFYNGKRGRQNKWFFYIFYPTHLFIIFLMRYLLL